MTIYVSGNYSGPNPSPGVGVARSLREAFPDERLVGVDYSPRSTGLHIAEFDDVWVLPGWRSLDLTLYRQQVEERLRTGDSWISGLDLEVLWAARALRTKRGWLGPSAVALDRVRKPPAPPAGAGWSVPAWVKLAEDDDVLHAFCRRHSWEVWVKGPYYEARFVTSWPQLEQARADLDRTWSGARLTGFVQEHVHGREGAVMLAGFRGRLLDAIWMEKREITAEGKTWAASVGAVPDQIRDALAKFVAGLKWTGGAEAELLFDADGRTWLMEWNPRFPAWAYGATLAGHNMPAALVAASRGTLAPAGKLRSLQFVRVVHEIPIRPGLPITAMNERSRTVPAVSKHPSGMPDLADRLARIPRWADRAEAVERTEPLGTPELSVERAVKLATPTRVLEAMRARRLLASTMAQAGAASDDLDVVIAYSIKTQPSRRLMRLAQAAGLWFEAITLAEADAVLSLGVPADRVILNGPAKWWPPGAHPQRLAAVFFDSLEESRRNLDRDDALRSGPRVRLPGSTSRFGVRLDEPRQLERLVLALRKLKQDEFAVHFHLASSAIGTNRWFELADAAIAWSTLLAREVRPPSMIDLGGGWHPADWTAELLPRISGLAERIRQCIPSVEYLVFEPGKAITQDCSVVLSRVKEVRRERSWRAVVVDASVAELPEARRFPRAVWRAEGNRWLRLERADDMIWGRSCMEHDVLAQSIDGRHVKPGDLIAFGSAGAYDSSMAYRFAYGP